MNASVRPFPEVILIKDNLQELRGGFKTLQWQVVSVVITARGHGNSVGDGAVDVLVMVQLMCW